MSKAIHPTRGDRSVAPEPYADRGFDGHANEADDVSRPANTPDETLPVRVMEPSTGVDAFGEAWRSLIGDRRQTRELGWRLFVRDTKAMYRQSFLGYVWILLPPIATAAVWMLLQSSRLVNIESTVPYPAVVLTGTVLWTAFNTSVIGIQSIVGESRGVLSKVRFPYEALVLSSIFKTCLNSLIPAAVLLPILLVFGVLSLSGLPIFMLSLLTLILMGCALSLAIVPISSLFADVSRGIQLALRFGFFATPVIFQYPPTGPMSRWLLLNPVTAPLVSGRHAIIGGETYLLVWTIGYAVFSMVLLAFSVVGLKVVMPSIIERMNS